MYKLRISILLAIVGLIKCQLLFPEDKQISYKDSQDVIENVTVADRSANVYEQFVNSLIARGILKLTLSVDKIMSNSRGSTDVAVYSPVGIAGALALVLLGANGKTFDELCSVLGLASGVNIQDNSQQVHEQLGRMLENLQRNANTDIGAQVKYATAIFVQDDYPIRSIYKQKSDDIYKSEILNLDFSSNPVHAQKVINAWVAERTNSKITNILADSPSSSTRVIICSALYFLGQWEKPFFNGLTRRRPFYPDGRKSTNPVMAEMMSNGGTFPYFKDTSLECEIMGFPYKGNKTTMYVILPQHSNKEVLRQLENRLSFEDIERLVENTKYTQAVILFPKMKLESTVDLKDALTSLGASSLFNPREANLGLLSPGYRVKSTIASNAAFSSNVIQNPIAYNMGREDKDSVLIFSRMGTPVNCTEVLDPYKNATKCVNIAGNSGRRVTRQTSDFAETVDSVRNLLNSKQENAENPGLYADQVLHKVYMDITETGTEAAAATSVSLSRGGDIVTFRVDVPFLFFIRDEESKLVLFWGSVKTPTPSFA